MSKFDTHCFSQELGALIALELTQRHGEFRDFAIRALAIDCHPWNGVLELCLLTDKDKNGITDMAEWKYFQFTDPQMGGGWVQARPLKKLMQRYWEESVDSGLASETTEVIMRACAVALRSKPVEQALKLFRRSVDFELWLADPDDPTQNYCSFY